MNTQRVEAQPVEGHTPTPWYFTGEELNSSTGREICRMVGYISLPDGAVSANGAFIEYAVNNIERLEKVNEALVAALADLVGGVRILMKVGDLEEGTLTLAQAEGALKLAKEPA